jgi:GT2 family glycosyltransferase
MITLSLVLYCNKDYVLRRLLASLELVHEDYQLFVIDNSPSDSLRFIFQNNEQIKYVFLGSNVGFGKGHNLGIKLAKECNPVYHVILNPDIYFLQDPFIELTKFISANSSVGVVGPKILYDDGQFQRTYRLLPTPLSMFLRRLPILKRIVNRSEELEKLDLNEINKVPFILGCFLMFNYSVLEDIGGFDERYFMYLEDVDICRSVWDINKDVVYCPHSSVFHSYEKGSRKSLKLLKLHFESMIAYFKKWGVFDEKRKEINRRARKYFDT